MARIAWSTKVSDTFLARAQWIVDDLHIGDSSADGLNKLMACMAWETGRSFSASVTNLAGSGATGLIQFMPNTAISLGTTVEKLAQMTPENQLNYVWKYFSSYQGKLKTLGDVYMAILWPKGIGEPDTYVLWDSKTAPTAYRQNSGIDINKDGVITKAEASAKVTSMLAEGLSAQNSREVAIVERPSLAQEPSVLPDIVDVLAPVATEVLTDVIDHKPVNVPAIIADATTGTKISNAISGWQGNLLGAISIVLALLLDPTFSSLLGRFTTSLATGNGRWGAFLALVGAGLIAYRSRKLPGNGG